MDATNPVPHEPTAQLKMGKSKRLKYLLIFLGEITLLAFAFSAGIFYDQNFRVPQSLRVSRPPLVDDVSIYSREADSPGSLASGAANQGSAGTPTHNRPGLGLVYISPPDTPPITLPNSRLVYVSQEGIKLHNFSTNSDVNLSQNIVKDVQRLLWSPGGQLAADTQECIPDGQFNETSSFLVPQAAATMCTYHNSLYLLDPTGGKPRLLLDNTFGDIAWAPNSQGFYVGENYYQGKPLYYGDHGLKPDEVKTYLIGLSGAKTRIDQAAFDQNLNRSQGKLDPSGKFSLKADGYWYQGYDKLVEVASQREYEIRPEGNYVSAFKARWSPDGSKIAFLYRPQGTDTNVMLGITTPTEVTNGDIALGSLGRPQAKTIDFNWLDSRQILVRQRTDKSKTPSLQGNIGIYYLETSEYLPLVENLGPGSLGQEALLPSPDGLFFVYDTRSTDNQAELVVSDLQGRVVIRLKGANPSWEPQSD